MGKDKLNIKKLIESLITKDENIDENIDENTKSNNNQFFSKSTLERLDRDFLINEKNKDEKLVAVNDIQGYNNVSSVVKKVINKPKILKATVLGGGDISYEKSKSKKNNSNI